jgi:hypothetical protein
VRARAVESHEQLDCNCNSSRLAARVVAHSLVRCHARVSGLLPFENFYNIDQQ